MVDQTNASGQEDAGHSGQKDAPVLTIIDGTGDPSPYGQNAYPVNCIDLNDSTSRRIDPSWNTYPQQPSAWIDPPSPVPIHAQPAFQGVGVQGVGVQGMGFQGAYGAFTNLSMDNSYYGNIVCWPQLRDNPYGTVPAMHLLNIDHDQAQATPFGESRVPVSSFGDQEGPPNVAATGTLASSPASSRGGDAPPRHFTPAPTPLPLEVLACCQDFMSLFFGRPGKEDGMLILVTIDRRLDHSEMSMQDAKRMGLRVLCLPRTKRRDMMTSNGVKEPKHYVVVEIRGHDKSPFSPKCKPVEVNIPVFKYHADDCDVDNGDVRLGRLAMARLYENGLREPSPEPEENNRESVEPEAGTPPRSGSGFLQAPLVASSFDDSASFPSQCVSSQLSHETACTSVMPEPVVAFEDYMPANPDVLSIPQQWAPKGMGSFSQGQDG